MKKSLEERRQAIWREYERRLGFQIPEEKRAKIEQEQTGAGIIDEERLEDLKSYLEGTVELVSLAAEASGNRRSNKQATSLKKRYEKPFQRRLYLVNFVLRRVENPKRIKRNEWERICSEWNTQNPSDIMTPPVFRVEYQRAKKESGVKSAYFDQHYRRYDPQVIELAKDTDFAPDKIREALGGIALHKGERAMAGTVEATRILLEKETTLEKQGEVDFSIDHKTKGGTP